MSLKLLLLLLPLLLLLLVVVVVVRAVESDSEGILGGVGVGRDL
jgi:hypothetical protein